MSGIDRVTKADEFFASIFTSFIARTPYFALGAAGFALFSAVAATAFGVPIYQVFNAQMALQLGFWGLLIVLELLACAIAVIAFVQTLFSNQTVAEKFGYFRMIFLPLVLAFVAAVPIYSGAFTYVAYGYLFHQQLAGASFLYDAFIQFHESVGGSIYRGAVSLAASISHRQVFSPSGHEVSFWAGVIGFIIAYGFPIAQRIAQVGEVGIFFYKAWIGLFPAAAPKSA